MLFYFFNLRKLTPPLNVYSELEEMLALRRLGWSYTMLADKFEVPKLTIRYLCRRFGLANNIPTIVIRKSLRATTETSEFFYDEQEGKINPGKTYAEYLQDEKDRKWRRLTGLHHISRKD